jgi:alkylated DNA repair protein (DNA oxidative demethylase)
LTADLFESVASPRPPREAMAEGAVLLRGFAKPFEADLIADFRAIVAQAPFRHMVTPGGHEMSVAMTNCGSAGWVTDRSGYRYDAKDPLAGKPWPEMPPSFRDLAGQAAAQAGFTKFSPDVCLINRYQPGARMSPSGQGRA